METCRPKMCSACSIFLTALCCSTTVAATVGSNRSCVVFQTDSQVCGMWSDRQAHIHAGRNDILQQVESHLTGCKGYCSAASAIFFFFLLDSRHKHTHAPLECMHHSWTISCPLQQTGISFYICHSVLLKSKRR